MQTDLSTDDIYRSANGEFLDGLILFLDFEGYPAYLDKSDSNIHATPRGTPSLVKETDKLFQDNNYLVFNAFDSLIIPNSDSLS